MSGSLAILQTTLCLPLQGERVLLGYKKTGFGQGKYTGFGGKLEPGETLEMAAVRELAEESGLRAGEAALQKVGVLRFEFPLRPAWNQEVHVFRLEAWAGTAAESDEMRPAWFPVAALPFECMWDDARYWLPPILAGQRLQAHFTFAEDHQTVAAAHVGDLTL